MPRRVLHIDVLRSIAILFMVEVHAAVEFAPTDISVDDPLGLIAASIGGLAAPLFVMISGWGSQRAMVRRVAAKYSKHSMYKWVAARFGFLMACQFLVNLIANHVFMWYTPGILSLLAICTLLVVPLIQLSTHTRIGIFSAVAIIPFALQALFVMDGDWISVTTTDDGIGWICLLLANGTYPLLPWVGFFILGGIVHDIDKMSLYSMIGVLLSISIGVLTLALLSDATWALTSGQALLTFFPASSAFVITAAFAILAAVAILERYEETMMDKTITTSFALIGRLSLTIYLLHFFPLLYINSMNIEPLSTEATLIAVLGYVLLWWPLAVIHQRLCPRFSLEELLRLINQRVERVS